MYLELPPARRQVPSAEYVMVVNDFVDGSEAAVRREVRVRPPETSREERVEIAVEVEMEKNVRLPSRVEAQIWVESGEMAMESISEVNGSGSDVGVRANIDQRRMV